MGDPTLDPAGPATVRRRYRFGMRWLLTLVVISAVVVGWVAREHHRAERRSALVAELGRVGVVTIMEEPTGLALVARKFVPGREPWLRRRIGGGWLERPTVVRCDRLEDEQVPFAVERLRRLGTVREVLYRGPPLTPRGVSSLRAGLPGVDVVPSANPTLHRYLLSQIGREHLAVEGLWLLATLVFGLLGVILFFVWPILRRRRPRTETARPSAAAREL